MLTIIFKDYILLKQLYLFMDCGMDSLATFYPKWVHVANYLRKTGIPMWSFNCGMGKDIFPGEINNPFSLILYASGNKLAESVIYVEILKFILTSITAYFYFRTINLSKYASTIGSLMLSFCGYMVAGSSGWYGHSTFVFYGVFWLFSFELLYKKNNIFIFPLAVFLMSSLNLFYIYIITVFLFTYASLRYFSEKGVDCLNFTKLMLKLTALGFLGLCMNAVFIFSPLLNMLTSPRVSGSSGYFHKLYSTPIFALASPMEYLTMIMRFFSTDILGSGDKYLMILNGKEQVCSVYKGWLNHFEDPLFYCSIPALLLAPQLFFILNTRKKKIYSLFLLLWILPLIFPFFRYALYLFSGNYYKGGLNFFIPAITVFIAVQSLNHIDVTGRLNRRALFITATILILMILFPFLLLKNDILVSRICLYAISLILSYAILIFLMSKPKLHRTSKLLFLLLLIGELVAFSSTTVNKRTTISYKDFTSKQGFNDYTIDAIKYLKSKNNGFYRIQKNYLSIPYVSFNDSEAQGFYGTPSYDSFNQKFYIDFLSGAGLLDPSNEIQTRWAVGVSQSMLMQSLVDVKYGLTKKQNNLFKKFKYKLMTKIGDVYVYENPLALPLGFTCDTYMTESNFRKLSHQERRVAMMKLFTVSKYDMVKLDGFRKVTPDFIPSCYTMMEYSKDVTMLRDDHMNIKKFTQNHIIGKINLKKKKMIIFSIPYDPGWSAQINGKDTSVLIVDFGLIGLIAPKGQNVIELKFTPLFLQIGLIISCIAIGIYTTLIFICVYSRHRKHSYSPHL